MITRVFALTRFLMRWLFKSFAGAMIILAAVAFWVIFYSPSNGRVPETDQFILLVGLLGAGLTLLATLSIASRANRAVSYPLIVRLPSRVEYMLSVMLSAIFYALIIQLALAAVILLQPGGAEVPLAKLIEIPPIWLAFNCFFSVLALHGSDLVASGWSRVYIFGLLTILLFSQSVDSRSIRWISDRLNSFAGSAAQRGWVEVATQLREGALWVTTDGIDFSKNTIGFVFWPFRAIVDGVQAGVFNNLQALAPGILMLYATILFLLAADLFATKDLYLTE